jgi:hypothetical protein
LGFWRPKGAPLLRCGIRAFRQVFFALAALAKCEKLHCVDFPEEVLRGEGANQSQTRFLLAQFTRVVLLETLLGAWDETMAPLIITRNHEK